MQAPNEIGRKTFFWYRVYCAALVLLYLAVIALGVMLLVFQSPSSQYSEQEIRLAGIVYTIVGTVFFLVSVIALFLPPKPYNWIVGIVMMALGMTSCCFLPALIPLLIFWVKPETKAFFGRN